MRQKPKHKNTLFEVEGDGNAVRARYCTMDNHCLIVSTDTIDVHLDKDGVNDLISKLGSAKMKLAGVDHETG